MRSRVRLARARVKARMLTRRDAAAALEHLKRDPLQNLLLIDMIASLGGSPAASEVAPQLVGAFARGELEGVASLRPSLALDAHIGVGAVEAVAPYLEGVETGLLKCADPVATSLWERLAARGRRALIDRMETAYVARAPDLADLPPPRGAVLRRAREEDLEALVLAARASLREEDRPDPFDGDPTGFRRWVRGRMPRARVVEVDGGVVFVGYADVRREEGWLIQGVYTDPDARRRGFAAAGMAGILREAFDSGAEHAQLAVVDGNTPAIRLYERLGFRPFAQLRTVLFV